MHPWQNFQSFFYLIDQDLIRIKVSYREIELKPGDPEEGGYLFYDEKFNSTVFYNLAFATDEQLEKVKVTFEINDGVVLE